MHEPSLPRVAQFVRLNSMCSRLTTYTTYVTIWPMKFFRLRMPDQVHEALRQVAFRKRVSMNALLLAVVNADEEVRRELERQAKT